MNHTSSPRPDGSRRRLLRGALSAPAVMTVCTGSAFAASSSMQCVQNQMGNPEFPGVASEPDLWRRVQLSAHLPDNADPGAYVYYHNDQGVWKRFDVTNNVLTDEVLDGVPNNPSGAPQQWVVIRYDEQGVAIGVGSGSDGSALTGTCWSSFIAANP